MKTVEVVFCMDTEGPCNDPDNNELLHNWSLVDGAMCKLFNSKFREKYVDSFGNNFKIGWFFLSWTGFKTNPRERDFGYHKVRDHYIKKWGKEIKRYGDEECWHYHHPHISGVGNKWGLEWDSSIEYKKIISNQIVDRGWFPVCFRSGGTIMNYDLSKWVEKWFPFDYSNRAPLKFFEMDWSGGVTDWRPYKPDLKNFKKEGSGKRYMCRCMDLHTSLYTSGEKDIVEAFNEASKNGSSVLSVFDHDYRDIESRILDFLSKISLVSEKYKDVNWRFSSPSDAIINVTRNYYNSSSLILDLVILNEELLIKVSSNIYQKYPWVAVKDNDGNIYQFEGPIDIISNRFWVLNVDTLENVDSLYVAVSNDFAQTAIKHVKL